MCTLIGLSDCLLQRKQFEQFNANISQYDRLTIIIIVTNHIDYRFRLTTKNHV